MAVNACLVPAGGFTVTGTPTLLSATILEDWSYPPHPKLSLVQKHARALLEALEEVKPLRLVATYPGTPVPATDALANREDLEVALDRARALMTILRGRSLERALRQVRSWLPQFAGQLQRAAHGAIARLIEAEQSLVFALGEPVDEEWLPAPAPPGFFPSDEQSIPLPEA